jgi:hypothetical protein
MGFSSSEGKSPRLVDLMFKKINQRPSRPIKPQPAVSSKSPSRVWKHATPTPAHYLLLHLNPLDLDLKINLN